MRGKRMILKSGLPEDAVSSGARVTMFGRGSVLVEGQRGVVELSPNCIRLRTGCGILSITGEALRLHELSMDAAMIAGDSIAAAAYGRPAGGG